MKPQPSTQIPSPKRPRVNGRLWIHFLQLPGSFDVRGCLTILVRPGFLTLCRTEWSQMATPEKLAFHRPLIGAWQCEALKTVADDLGLKLWDRYDFFRECERVRAGELPLVKRTQGRDPYYPQAAPVPPHRPDEAAC